MESDDWYSSLLLPSFLLRRGVTSGNGELAIVVVVYCRSRTNEAEKVEKKEEQEEL